MVEIKEGLMVVRIFDGEMKGKKKIRALYFELELREKEKGLGRGFFVKWREERWPSPAMVMGEGS